MSLFSHAHRYKYEHCDLHNHNPSFYSILKACHFDLLTFCPIWLQHSLYIYIYTPSWWCMRCTYTRPTKGQHWGMLQTQHNTAGYIRHLGIRHLTYYYTTWCFWHIVIYVVLNISLMLGLPGHLIELRIIMLLFLHVRVSIWRHWFVQICKITNRVQDLLHISMIKLFPYYCMIKNKLLLIDVVFRRNTTVLVPNNLNLKTNW